MAFGYVGDDVTIADCKDQQKADAFFEKRNQATGNWRSQSKRNNTGPPAAVNGRNRCDG